MKSHLNKVLTPVTALAVSWSFIACEKPAEKSAETPKRPAIEQPTTKGADSAKPAVAATAPAATTSGDVAKLREQFGFAAHLTKDVEMFSESYRMAALWASIAKSKWAAKLVEVIKSKPEGQQMLDQWNSPQAQKPKEYAEAFLGNEFFFAGGAGFSKTVAPWVSLGQQFYFIYYQSMLTGGLLGGSVADRNQALQRTMKDNAAELIPKATKLELPPIIYGFKAGKIRTELDGFIKQGLDAGALPPQMESATFKVGDKYDFQSLSVTVRKVIPQVQEEQLKVQLKELLGDDAAAKSAVDAVMAKRIEIAWGWVEDYLVISLGSDHAHLKLASSGADSALAIPEVAARAALFANKSPISMEFESKAFFDSLDTPMELAKPFAEAAQSLQGIISPDALKGMTEDVKRIEGKVQALFKSISTPRVSVSYLDGGLRMDSLGGPRLASATASQPLTFSTLSTPTTAIAIVSGGSSANDSKTSDLIEEGAAMVWGWYEKYGRTMVPEDGKSNAAMAEAMALPMVKEFWRSCRLLGKAFGDNSAFLVDLNGKMPELPHIPPAVVGGKAPRFAIALELKDRAALSEAWKGFEKLVKQGIALIPQGADAPPIPEPMMKKEGDVEIHYVDLPVKMGDLLPHIAISKDKWIFSSSLTYSTELAKLPTTGTAKLDGDLKVDFGAVANFADLWVKLMAANPTEFFGNSNAAAEFQKNKPLIDAGLLLFHSLKSAGIQIGDEGGKTHVTLSLQVEDLK